MKTIRTPRACDPIMLFERGWDASGRPWRELPPAPGLNWMLIIALEINFVILAGVIYAAWRLIHG